MENLNQKKRSVVMPSWRATSELKKEIDECIINLINNSNSDLSRLTITDFLHISIHQFSQLMKTNKYYFKFNYSNKK